MIPKIKSLLDRVLRHSGFGRYFANTSWLMGEKLLRMVVGLFVGVWVARYLGPEQFGLFSYVQSFVGIFVVIATLGLDSIVVRELVNNSDDEAASLIGTTFWLKLTGAFITLCVLGFAVNFTSNDAYTNGLVFIVASATIFQSCNVIDFYFQSKVMSKFIVYANIISLLISTVVKVMLILSNAPLVAFVWIVLFDSFVLAVGFVYFFSKVTEFNFNNLQFNKLIAINLLRDSWPLILSGTALMIQARIDQVMIKELLNSTEVGYYSVAIRLIELVAFVTIVLKSSLYPAIQNAKKHSTELYRHRLLNFYRLNFLLFLVVAIPLFIFAEQIVIFLFGVEYQPAGILLALMSIRLFFANMGSARSVFILSENLMKFSLMTMVLGTVANIALNYLWIPEYGAIGAVIATIVSFAVTIFLVDMIYSKTRGNVLLQVRSIFTFYKINLR